MVKAALTKLIQGTAAGLPIVPTRTRRASDWSRGNFPLGQTTLSFGFSDFAAALFPLFALLSFLSFLSLDGVRKAALISPFSFDGSQWFPIGTRGRNEAPGVVVRSNVGPFILFRIAKRPVQEVIPFSIGIETERGTTKRTVKRD